MTSPAMAMSFPSVASVAVIRLARVHVVLTRDPFPVSRLTPASCTMDTETLATRGLHLCHNVS